MANPVPNFRGIYNPDQDAQYHDPMNSNPMQYFDTTPYNQQLNFQPSMFDFQPMDRMPTDQYDQPLPFNASTDQNDPNFWGNIPALWNLFNGQGNNNGNSNWLSSLLGLDGPASGMLIPAVTQALKQWNDAGRYEDIGREAAGMATPFGQDQRNYYQDLLRKSYEDPNDFLQHDPGTQAALTMGLQQLDRSNAAKGMLGAGQAALSAAQQGQLIGQQHLDQYRQQLQPLTGAQFNPATGAAMLMQGSINRINSENSALQSLFRPFGNQGGQTIINNQNGGGSGSGGPNQGVLSANNLPQGLLQALQAGGSQGMAAASQLLSQGIRQISMPDGTTWHLGPYANMGAQTGDNFYPHTFDPFDPYGQYAIQPMDQFPDPQFNDFAPMPNLGDIYAAGGPSLDYMTIDPFSDFTPFDPSSLFGG